MDDLLKDAIADAKAVRETALANAKLALEEAFTPRIQSMLSQKIQSEIDDEDDSDEAMHGGEDHDEEEEAPEAPEAEAPEVAVEPEEGEEAADIADEEEDADEAMHGGDDHDEEAGEDSDEGYDESKVIEIDGVKYAPVVSEEEEDEDEAMHEEEDEDEGYSEDLDLEAVLAELESETVTEEEDEDEVKDESVNEEEDNDEGEEVEEEVNENDVSSDIGSADNKVKPEAGDSSKIGQGPEGEGSDKPAGKEDENSEIVDDLKEDIEISEDIDLEEVLKALTEEEDADEEEEVDESVNEELNTIKADLEEHRNVVKYLRGKLNEVNLLNAKLLFTNKLFRNFGLSNEQKLKVVETFDRATNLREVKLVFSTLAESFGNKVASKPSKKQESKGSSSKPVASTKPKTEEVISEGFDMKERFQKLAKIL